MSLFIVYTLDFSIFPTAVHSNYFLASVDLTQNLSEHIFDFSRLDSNFEWTYFCLIWLKSNFWLKGNIFDLSQVEWRKFSRVTFEWSMKSSNLGHFEAFWAIFGYISAPNWLKICYRNHAYIHTFTIFSWQCYNTTNYYTNWQISITQLSTATVLWLRFWLSLESTRLNMTQTKFVWLDLSQIMTQYIFVWFDSSRVTLWVKNAVDLTAVKSKLWVKIWVNNSSEQLWKILNFSSLKIN